MRTEPSKVTATAGPSPDTIRIQHNDFPGLATDGDSLEDAAANLVQALTSAIGETEDGPHRESLRQAVAEVQAFIENPAD